MQQTGLHREPASAVEAGHELSDLRPGYIALFGVGLAVVVTLVVVITFVLMRYRAAQQTKRETPPPQLARERVIAPQPRLQLVAPDELREMRAGEDAALNSYGWVDRDGGVVRIPIERAIEILAAKGLPARPEGSMRKVENEKRRSDGGTR